MMAILAPILLDWSRVVQRKPLIPHCLLMDSRRKYNRIGVETRERIIGAFVRGENWRLVAQMNGVNCKTAYKWLHVDNITYEAQARRGHRMKILSESQIDTILEWISEVPTLTLGRLKVRVKDVFGKEVSITTISRYLDGRLITVKKLCHIPVSMQSDDNKELRRLFVYDLLECYGRSMTVCWIDETNFNLFCTRTMGRSLKGTKASISVTNSRGKNLHLIGAITENGVVNYTTRRGAYNSNDCVLWFRTLLDQLKTTTATSAIVVICDNAPCHTHLESVFMEEDYAGGKLLRLAPYSPMLNPIESVWSSVKAKVKTELRIQHEALVRGDPRGVLSQQEWRMRLMEQIATSSMDYVTGEQCANFVRHTQRFCVQAMNDEDMF